jgi:hypothetical protein
VFDNPGFLFAGIQYIAAVVATLRFNNKSLLSFGLCFTINLILIAAVIDILLKVDRDGRTKRKITGG